MPHGPQHGGSLSLYHGLSPYFDAHGTNSRHEGASVASGVSVSAVGVPMVLVGVTLAPLVDVRDGPGVGEAVPGRGVGVSTGVIDRPGVGVSVALADGLGVAVSVLLTVAVAS
jgi:hypothetical protein